MSVPSGDIAPTRTERDENFPVASRLIAPRLRAPILAFYRFARAADDIADHPTLPPEAKLDGLAALEAGLTGADEGDRRGLALRLALADRNLTSRHALDLLAAFRLDVIKNRYRDWGELMGYCALSAAPVGRFVLDVHGEPADRWPASDAICASLQVINHLQDCGRDFSKLDRVYLPQETLDRHRAAVTDLQAPRASGELRAVIGELTGRAGALLEEGASLPGAVKDLRLACEIGAIVGLARANCVRLEKRDPLSERVHPTKAAFAATGLLGALAGARAFALGDHRGSKTQ
jgi:hydroxysqualene synthase